MYEWRNTNYGIQTFSSDFYQLYHSGGIWTDTVAMPDPGDCNIPLMTALTTFHPP